MSDSVVANLENQLKEKDAQLELTTNELSQTKELVRSFQNSSDSKAKEQADLILKLETDLKQVQDLLAAKEEEIKTKDTQNNEKISQITKQHEEQVTELQQEIEDYTSSIDKLKSIILKLTGEKRALSEDHEKLLDSVDNMKTAIKTKLKEHEDENLRLKNHLSVLENAHTDLNRIYESNKKQLDELTEEANKYKNSAKTNGSALQSARKELEELQQTSSQEKLGHEALLNEHIFRRKELEEQVTTLESKISKETESKAQLEKTIATLQSDFSKTLQELNQLRQDYDVGQGNLMKLQGVVEELHNAQAAEVEFAVEKLQRQMDSRGQLITELEYRAATAEAKLADYSKKAKKVDVLAAEIQTKSAETQRLRDELNRVNDQFLEASKKLRRMGGGEDTVSREFLAGLFTRFTGFPRGDPRKFEMLEVISAALRLSPEDQVEIGLVREASQAHIYPSLHKSHASPSNNTNFPTSTNDTLSPQSRSPTRDSSTYSVKSPVLPKPTGDIGSI